MSICSRIVSAYWWEYVVAADLVGIAVGAFVGASVGAAAVPTHARAAQVSEPATESSACMVC